ncbi:hypothetical protein NQ317_009519 [Molorchus minor]|uniref:Uncharacterized protein n=1 Tax=Molorchus minor TaxID=1323400 RepID=A0ABQ9IUQ5_9CUCU|nr:hypothetical protein NQ317_009519 [Molorchus minor]
MDSELCIALAFALQYARMCVFCWMLMMTHNMHHQFRTGLHLVPITDNRITRNFIRSPYMVLPDWLGAALYSLGSQCTNPVPRQGREVIGYSKPKKTELLVPRQKRLRIRPVSPRMRTDRYHLLLSGPIGSVSPLHNQHAGRHTDEREDEAQKDTPDTSVHERPGELTIVLSIVLALATVTKLSRSEPFWIAYHVGQGLQGIFVAMLVTCNCQVLKLYTRSIKSRATRHVPCYVGRGSAAGLSKSTSLQLLTWDPVPDTV